MTNFSSWPFVGWTLIASGVFWILQLIFVTIFYIVGSPFGTLSDFSTVVMTLLMVPLVFSLHKINRANSSTISLVSMVVGIAGILTVATGSILLIADVIDFGQSLWAVFGGFAAIGVWMLISFWIARRNERIPPKVGLWGLIFGLAFLSVGGMLPVLGALQESAMGLAQGAGQSSGGGFAGFWSSPWIYPALIGGPFIFFGYPIWSIWLGRIFLSGRLSTSYLRGDG